MSATFSRLKTWVAEKLNASDLNAEIDNILTNLSPSGMSGSSANVAGMQVQTDPGEVGTESLATTLAGEIERLRYEIAQIKGETYWYSGQDNDLATLNTELNSILNAQGQQDSRLTSGESVSGSSQSYLITPEGAGNGNNLTVNATATDLIYYVGNVKYTATEDVTLSFTASAPVANNTCLINNTQALDLDFTKRTGEDDIGVNIDNIGSEITSLDGKLGAFRLDTGAGSEYLIARINTTATRLQEIRRGWFFDEAGAGIPPIVYADNDTLTLMAITWVFFDTSQNILSTVNEPILDAAEPAAPANGDFWYDTINKVWKSYDGAAWNDTLSTFVGIAIQDENGDCVAARSQDFSSIFDVRNTLILNYSSTSVMSTHPFGNVKIGAENINYLHAVPEWDIAADLDGVLVEAASTRYWFYLKEDGTTVISDAPPFRFSDRDNAYYHRHNMWRAIGHIDNDASSNFDKETMDSYLQGTETIESRYQYGGTSGTYQNTTQAANTTITAITTNVYIKKGPVLVMLVSEGSGGSSSMGISSDGGSTTTRTGSLNILRDSVEISEHYFQIGHPASTSYSMVGPWNCMTFDTPGRGFFTYSVTTNPNTDAYFDMEDMRLLVVEL